MTRTWAYCRVSTQRQFDRGNSLASQSSDAIRFAEYQQRLELDLGQVLERDFGELGKFETRQRVICEAISGLHVPFAQRPKAKQLLEHLERGDALIITKLDRLGRSVGDMRTTLNDLAAKGVAVYVLDVGSGDLPVNATQGATGKLLLGILMQLAEFESDRRGERVRDSNAKRREKGRCTGEVPLFLTYTSDPNGPKGSLVPCEFNRSRARAFYEAYTVHGMWPEQIVNAASAGFLSRGRWSKEAKRFVDGRKYSPPMVRRLIRGEHQVRQLAAELKLSIDDPAVIFRWWETFQFENENLRRSIPGDCRRGDPGGRRLNRRRRSLSPAGMASLLDGLVRSSGG